MRRYSRWLMIVVTSGLVALIGTGLHGTQAGDSKRVAAEELIKGWEPKVDGVEDLQQFVASPEGMPGMAAATFRVVGPSFERLWNHYADLCGIADRYESKRFLVTGKVGTKGSYVVSDRASADARAGRGLSLFMLRTDRYTVSVTIQPDPAGKALLGSIAVVTP